MIVILDVDGQKFSFNGVNYYKNFLPKVIGDKIEILNTYDSNVRLTDYPTKYDEFSVNGTTYANVSDLQNNLLSVIFSRVSLTNAGAIKTYQTLADFNAVSPVPEDGTTFFIANDPNDANNGEWSVVSGSPIQNARTVENVVEESNTSKGVSGKAVFDSLQTRAPLERGNQLYNDEDEDIILNSYMTASGSVVANTDYLVTGFIKVNPSTQYSASNEIRFTCYFDENKNIITGGSNAPIYFGTPITTTSLTHYVRLTIFKSFTLFMFNEGATSLPYEDFYINVPEIYLTKFKEDVVNSTLPDNSFNKYTDLTSLVKEKTIANLSPYQNAGAGVSNFSKTIIDGVLNFSGDIDFDVSPLFWLGYEFGYPLYATEDKEYVIVLEGDITSVNARNLELNQITGINDVILQDLTDNVTTPFSGLYYRNYPQGQENVGLKFNYVQITRRDAGISEVSASINYTCFSVFEKIEGFTQTEYIESAKLGIIKPVFTAPGTATETYVDNKVETALGNVSKLSANDLITDYDVECIMTYGQSLAVGTGASDNSTDFKNSVIFNGGNLFTSNISTTSFVDVESSANVSYTPIMATLTTVLNLIENENKVDVSNFGYTFLPIAGGGAGGSIASMSKGTTEYNYIINAVTSAKTLANQQGKTFAFRVINFVQGESDRFDTKQQYYDKAEQLFIDFNTDIKAITGQSEDIIFIIHQTSPWLGVDLGSGAMTQINVQEAQVQLAIDLPNVYLCGASYQFSYVDYYHPSDRAVIGLQQGVALKRLLNDGEDWVTFRPISHTVFNDGTNYYTQLKFDVPVKPMRFDVSGDAWHNPNGMQPNYGFKLLSIGVEKQTELPFIVKGDTVVLTSTENPIGMTIQYAVNGHYGGGNLCDSQNIVVRNKNTDYVIDNFAVGFSEYIID